ncbi:MAG: P-type DNA transfer ATPase VirB11 [Proteobacteria bacterium]|nr:P-type DNA transfer ATPase VirB11 [Pseudomonadota bacterium]
MSCAQPQHRVTDGSPCVAGPANSALELTLRALRPLLARPGVTELCINRPHEVFIETHQGWRQESLGFADFEWCSRFARLIANATRQRVDETSPLLSASLPDGERVQIVLPPATTLGCVAITIRRAADRVWSIEELGEGGIFDRGHDAAAVEALDAELLRLHADGQHAAFLRLAVRSRRNIVVSGATGSGKTTWTKALIREIPGDERLITIEDARELVLDTHPNHVRLFYSKDGQGLAQVTPKQLLESCLRMRPDRILLAELRAEEAYDYLRNVSSGHPGSITSVHANSAELAFEQLVLLVKQSPAGRGLTRRDIRVLLYLLVDVVVQCARERHRRVIREIWFDPQRRARLARSSGGVRRT